jgi:CDP-paratose 2-epimerase
VLINRCGVLAGPWQMGKSDQGVMTFWMAAHLLGRNLRYIGFGGHGKQVRDVLHADDFAHLVRRQIAAIGAWRGEVYNVGGGLEGSLSLRETTEICARLAGRTVTLGCEPATRPADVIWYVTDNTRVSQAFGWAPERRPEPILADIRDWLISLGEAGLHRLFGA